MINIVTEEQTGPHPWILRRAALEIQKAAPDRVTVNSKPGAINYCINYAHYGKIDGKDGIKVGHYTHLEESGPFRQRFLETIPKFDYYTVTCDITKRILVENGADEGRILKARYGSDERLERPDWNRIIFGVAGRTYPSGRKGEFLVQLMVDAGFHVYGWGKGWPCECPWDRHWGKEIYQWNSLCAFYDEIDYLVITSTNEGGPVPVIDAIRAGVPVIAPDVGWCWEFPVIRYEKGSWESLHAVLKALTEPPTWEQWAEDHLRWFDTFA